MQAIAIVLNLLGVVGMAIGLFSDSAVGRTVSLDLMNFKVLMVTGGGAIFIAGCVLYGASAIVEAIVAPEKKKKEGENASSY
jgi:hypothetical protein